MVFSCRKNTIIVQVIFKPGTSLLLFTIDFHYEMNSRDVCQNDE